MPQNVMCKNCNNYRNNWCERVIDSPDPNMVRDCRHFWQRTNADRIRAMSDEELAAFLDCFGCCQHCSEHERLSDNRWFSDERCDEMCVTHCLEWLKQPAEVDNGQPI